MGGDCNADGTISLTLADQATCTITNNDITPTLKVVKNIVNDNGGTVTDPNAFGLMIDGIPVQNDMGITVDAGNHTVSEVGLAGYVPGTWGGDCNPDGAITLALDQNATCTISNDDATPSLALVKEVINDNGGTSFPSAWTLTATGPTGFSGNGPLVNSGNGFEAGTYDLSESGPAGYNASNWVCVGGTQNDVDTITLALGESATCTVTNNDISPTLKVVKHVINDNGGTVTDQNAFGLSVDGNPVLHNVAITINAGTHTAREIGLPGYEASDLGGDCNPNGTIALALDQDATCTITNDDIEPGLTLVKEVINNNGGSAQPTAWTLTATGPAGFSGSGPSVSNNPGFHAGTYNLSESGGPGGYATSDWVCVGGTQNDGDTITLAPGESATCTITNDDIAPTLKVVKTIINNDGGTVTDPDAFGLKINGATVLHNAVNELNIGVHTVSEDGQPGYLPGSWGGDCNADGTISLALADQATCTITNDDIAPTLTIAKTIVNDDDGVVEDPNAFGLRIDGNPVQHNAVNIVSAGNHTVSEVGLTGYVPGTWSGDCNPDGTISLVLGQNATCSITNDDTTSTSLTLVKQVINDNGGTECSGLSLDRFPP